MSRLFTILYICLIFGNSATPAEYSSMESNWVTDLLNGFLGRIGISFISFPESVVRKLAHLTEYTGLGIMLTISLSRYRFFQGSHRWRLIPTGFLIACVDEGIQYFSPGRNSSILDALLDTCGVLLGVILITAFSRLRSYLKSRKTTAAQHEAG